MDNLRQVINEFLWEDLNKSAPRFSAFNSKKVDSKLNKFGLKNAVFGNTRLKLYKVLQVVTRQMGIKLKKILGL